MISCKQFENLVFFTDRELTEEELARAARHISRCPDCSVFSNVSRDAFDAALNAFVKDALAGDKKEALMRLRQTLTQ